MHINKDHMYHGAALTQIAEHSAFTAINAFKHNGERSRCGFRINDAIGAYLKYSTDAKGVFDEYKFTFQQAHLDELDVLEKSATKVFVVLVCIEDKEICVLPISELRKLIDLRRGKLGKPEKQYQILVTVPTNKQFRVYINAPGVKGKSLGELKVKRSDFPDRLFTA